MSGYSLANFAEVLFPSLDAVAPKSVIEVGAYRGAFTAELLDWASKSGATITAIEPEPPDELEELISRHPELEVVREPSHDALRHLPRADVVILDGDHNYYTLSEELRLIDEGATDAGLPLLLFHDVCWPHARRDTYYAPDRIPEEHRQPIAEDAAVVPGDPGVVMMGLRYRYAAAREGGPRNGVLTAIEDFIGGREDLRLAVVPAFFGLGIVWSHSAPWADAVGDVVDPWDGNPILKRLEENRLEHIVDHIHMENQQAVLRSFLHSRAFALAERMSRIRQGGEPVFSREQVKRMLGESSRDESSRDD